MKQTFTHPLWKRSVTVDDEGIHEARQGRGFAAIRWEELSQLDSKRARSDSGAMLSLWIEPAHCASQMWRQRNPARWQSNHDRLERSCHWAVYCWLPLLLFGSSAVLYPTIWWFRGPDVFRQLRPRMHRYTIGVTALVLILWSLHGICRIYLRRSRKKN